MPRIFSSRQVGKLVGADPSSVNRWIDSGKLNAYRTPGGHRRVLYDDLIAFLETCGMPLPEELMPERRSVLLIDDDASSLRSLRRGLLRADKALDVETCSSGVEALIKLGAQKPDVVVIAASLSGVDGVEVCKRIKGNPDTKGTVVIATAGKPTPSVEKRFMAAGATALLAKPLKAAMVIEAMRGGQKGRRAR